MAERVYLDHAATSPLRPEAKAAMDESWRTPVIDRAANIRSCYIALGPVAVLYFPAAHAEHRPPLDPVYPTLQAQFVCDPLDAAANEFAGHTLQFGLPSGDHSPGAQLRQVSFPVAP